MKTEILPRGGERMKREDPSPARIFPPVKVYRIFEAVIDRITDAIDAQGLKAGDRLPNESELSKLMQVSRPTLRQALRVLETSGVLKIRAGQSGGVFVASEMVPVDVLGRNNQHEVDHAAELIATRRLLEPIVYHLAADNASEDAIERIADTIKLMEKHISDPRMIQRADGMFHRRVAHAAGNPILLRTMDSIYRELNPLRGALSTDAVHGGHLVDVYSRLLNAIRTRDHDTIEKALEETFVALEVEFNVRSRFATRVITTG